MKLRILILSLGLILISASDSEVVVTAIEKLKSAYLTNVSVVSEDELIVTTQYAGLFKSTNRGNTFTELAVGLIKPNRLFENNFNSILVDGQKIYAGGGSLSFVQGAGFHVSTDGGASFTLRGLQGRNINAIKQYLDKILLATQGQGVQSYENEAITSFNTGIETANVNDLFYDEGNTNKLLAGTDQNLFWLNTTNQTWEATNFNQPVTTFEKGDGNTVFLASFDEIYETLNFENFDLVTPLNLPEFYNYQSLAYHNPNLWAAVTPSNFENNISLVHRYNTNTSIWEDNTAGLPKNFGTPQKIETYGNNKFLLTNTGFYRGTIDNEWETVTDYGLSAGLFTKVGYNTYNNRYYAGGALGDLQYAENMGGEWTKDDWGLKVGVQINDFAFTPNGTFAVQFSSLRYKENIGEKFEPRETGISANLFNSIAYNSNNNTTVLGTNSGLYYSTNLGIEWQLSNKSEYIDQVKYSETQEQFYATGFNDLFRSDGLGQNFGTFASNVISIDFAIKDDLSDWKLGVASFNEFYEIDANGNSTQLGLVGLPSGGFIQKVIYDPLSEAWFGAYEDKVFYYDYDQGAWVDLVELENIITDFFQGFIAGGSKTSDNGTILIGTLGGGLYTDASLTDIGDNGSQFVNHFSLKQNYPNPFNPTTKISYSIPEASFVTLKIYDLLGKEITTLINEEKSAGSYNINFDAEQLASGIYFYKIQAGNFIETKKMMLIK